MKQVSIFPSIPTIPSVSFHPKDAFACNESQRDDRRYQWADFTTCVLRAGIRPLDYDWIKRLKSREPRDHGGRSFRNGANRLLLPSRQTELAQLIQLIILRSIDFFSPLPRPSDASVLRGPRFSCTQAEYENKLAPFSLLLIYIRHALSDHLLRAVVRRNGPESAIQLAKDSPTAVGSRKIKGVNEEYPWRWLEALQEGFRSFLNDHEWRWREKIGIWCAKLVYR